MITKELGLKILTYIADGDNSENYLFECIFQHLPDMLPGEIPIAILERLIVFKSDFNEWASHPQYIKGFISEFDDETLELKGEAVYKKNREIVECNLRDL